MINDKYLCLRHLKLLPTYPPPHPTLEQWKCVMFFIFTTFEVVTHIALPWSNDKFQNLNFYAIWRKSHQKSPTIISFNLFQFKNVLRNTYIKRFFFRKQFVIIDPSREFMMFHSKWIVLHLKSSITELHCLKTKIVV